jgi:hypothetical protein
MSPKTWILRTGCYSARLLLIPGFLDWSLGRVDSPSTNISCFILQALRNLSRAALFLLLGLRTLPWGSLLWLVSLGASIDYGRSRANW